MCTSVNETAIHGIPSQDDILKDGDLISVDVTIFTGDAHGDACETYFLGDDKKSLQHRLLSCSRRCCDAGIAACGAGVPLSAIATAISQEAFESPEGFRVVAGIGGHGIGSYFHGPPYVAHSIFEQDSEWSEYKMVPGNVFTIEPCIAAQPNSEKLELLDEIEKNVALPVVSKDDGWSVRTTDNVLTAQFEEMVLITEQGYRVLTR